MDHIRINYIAIKDTNDEGVSTYVFHCYICQIHGDILTLIQQVSGYTFGMALKTVGDFLGVDVTQPKKLVRDYS